MAEFTHPLRRCRDRDISDDDGGQLLDAFASLLVGEVPEKGKQVLVSTPHALARRIGLACARPGTRVTPFGAATFP